MRTVMDLELERLAPRFDRIWKGITDLDRAVHNARQGTPRSPALEAFVHEVQGLKGQMLKVLNARYQLQQTWKADQEA
jgi:hypothetical protein